MYIAYSETKANMFNPVRDILRRCLEPGATMPALVAGHLLVLLAREYQSFFKIAIV